MWFPTTRWELVKMLWKMLWTRPAPKIGCAGCVELQRENAELRKWAAKLEDENWQLLHKS